MLLARSVSEDVKHKGFATAVPVSRALKREAEDLGAATDKRAACVRLIGAAESLKHIGDTFDVRNNDAAQVVKDDIRKIREVAEEIRRTVLASGVSPAPRGDQVLELQRRVAQLNTANAGLNEALLAEQTKADNAVAEVQALLEGQRGDTAGLVATIGELRADKTRLEGQNKAIGDRMRQLQAENDSLSDRLQKATRDLTSRASPALVADLRRQIRQLQDRGQPSTPPESDEGPSVAPSEEVPGPTDDDATDAASDLFSFDKAMPLATRGTLREGEDGVIAALTHTSIREARPFDIPDRAGNAIHNIAVEMGKKPKKFGWNRAQITFTPGEILNIFTEKRPWKGPVRNWSGFYGVLVGFTAFVRVTTSEGTVNLSISKEARDVIVPVDGKKWTQDTASGIQMTKTDDNNRFFANTTAYDAEEVEEVFAHNVYSSERNLEALGTAFASVRIFTTDTVWTAVRGNVTTVYIYGNDLADAQTAVREYQTTRDDILRRLQGNGITYAEAQKSKQATLQKLAARGKILYVTYPGVRGIEVPTISEQLPKNVSWSTNEDEEFADW